MFEDLSPRDDVRFAKLRKEISPTATWRFSLGSLFLATTAFGFVMLAMRLSSRLVWIDVGTWMAAVATAQGAVWLAWWKWRRPELWRWATVCVAGLAIGTLLARTAGMSVMHPLGYDAKSILLHYLAWMKVFGAGAVFGLAIGWLASFGNRHRPRS
jgi:hypothetical protein